MVRSLLMRFVFPILTLAACIGGFLVYNHVQQPPSTVTGGGTSGSTTLPSPATIPLGEQGSQIHPGTGSWVVQYDRVTGLRSYRFRADHYDPHPDGQWDVTNPEIELFQPNGQIIHIQGVHGVIGMPPGADKGMLAGGMSEPPRNGLFHHVICKMFASDIDETAEAPQMTLTMDNAKFDNDTYSLFTAQDNDDSGQIVQADNVPVKIFGKSQKQPGETTTAGPDYEFSGKGLVLYWNDPLKQLRSLDVAHGDYLIIHNTSAMSVGQPTVNPPPTAPAAPAKNPTTVAPPVPAPVQNPAPPAAQPVVAVNPPNLASTQPAPKPRYYATFYKNVRVLQGTDQSNHWDKLIQADTMGIDFNLKSDSPAAPPTAPPAPAAPPITPSAPVVQATPAPTLTPTPTLNPPPNPIADAPKPQSTPAPDTKQDIKVLWDGRLTIVPTPDAIAAADPLLPGNSIIHLQGAPVIVNGKASSPDQPATEVRCATLIYKSVDSSIQLAEGPGVPLKITQLRPDGHGPIINAQHLTFSKIDHLAVLDGAGRALFPDPNDP